VVGRGWVAQRGCRAQQRGGVRNRVLGFCVPLLLGGAACEHDASPLEPTQTDGQVGRHRDRPSTRALTCR